MPILITETIGHIEILTINRPEAMNSLTYELYMALEDAIRNSTARVVIITGAGDKAFCAGDDVKQVLSKGTESQPEDYERRSRRTGGLQPTADALLYTNIPVVAAVNGYALGWGMEIALMADIRIASPAAKFSEMFVQRGVSCDAPALGRLAQIVGRERASELLFTGDVIEADEALRMGLVSRVVPGEDLMPTATALAERIASNPPKAVQAIKAGLRRTLDPDWRDVGEWATREIYRLMETDDAKGSSMAFIEKRKPVFSGK